MSRAEQRRDGRERPFEVSNADRVVFPDLGVTKGEVVDYHRRIAEHAMPYLQGRPLAVKRYPQGVAGEGFFQKRAADHYPAWIQRVDVPKREGGSLPHVVVTEADVLPYLANQGVIEFHPWLTSAADLEHPDQLVIDLDPPGDDVDAARDATRRVKALLDDLELPSVLKTSGSKGYHVHVPLDHTGDADEARRVAAQLAALLGQRHADELTDETRKAGRKGRVLVDYLRNGYGQTLVAPYSLRARPDAPVSTPIGWDELADTHPRRFTVRNIFRRLGQLRDDPWADLRERPVALDDVAERLDAAATAS